MTAPCRPAIEVESYISLAQVEVQHWVLELTTEDKKMITSGGWLSDEIVDTGQKLLKSIYPHIQGLQEVALGMVLSYSIAKSEFIQIMNTSWRTPLGKGFKLMKRYMSMTVHQVGQLVLY